MSASRRLQLPELTVISWRDIPAQVTAADGSRTVRSELSGRFLQAIDAAAMAAGLVQMDEYLEEWRRETRPCGDDLDRAVTEESARLESEFTEEVLRRLVQAGGIRERTDPGAADPG